MKQYTYKYVLLDFDGTIVNTAPGIMESMIFALEKYNAIYDYEKLKKSIGLSVIDMVLACTKVDEKKADDIVQAFRQHYSEVGVNNYELYPGFLDLLVLLKDLKVKMSIVSLKPIVFIEEISKKLGIRHYFDTIIGTGVNDSNKDKSVLIKSIENHIDKNSAIMIGDHANDIRAGKAIEIKTLAVTYGYSNIETLRQECPDFIASIVAQIQEVLINEN